MRSMRTPDATHCIMLEVTSREGIQKRVYERLVGKGAGPYGPFQQLVHTPFRNGCRSFFGVQGHDEHAQRSDGKGVGA